MFMNDRDSDEREYVPTIAVGVGLGFLSFSRSYYSNSLYEKGAKMTF